jgi:hypothetical protein
MNGDNNYKTSREQEVGIEFGETIKKLNNVIKDVAYVEECKTIHENLIKNLIKHPLETYKTLLVNKDSEQKHLEAVVLILLKKVFEISETQNETFEKLKKETKSESIDFNKELKREIDMFNAMFQQCIIKVSHIFFKNRYYLTYRPTIETIVDLLEFIDVMCRSNSDTCKGGKSPYFHSRRYLYYLKYMLEQYDNGHILIPTFVSIGATDFIKTRCIPIYFLGCNVDSEYADEYYNTPLEFFSHDVQHARRQLYYTERELYKLNEKSERFKNDNNSRSIFDIDKNIFIDNYNEKFLDFISKMSRFTKEKIEPLLLTNSKSKKYNPPLNNFITTYNEELDKGLRSMRKMILFEILHEAANVPLSDVIIETILLNVHKTPIERIALKTDKQYADVENVIYEDPTTLSNVLYKTQGVFFDTLENRVEYVVPMKYRNSYIVALAALQIYMNLKETHDTFADDIFNDMLYLTLNNKNRLQSTQQVVIESLISSSKKKYKISDVIDSDGILKHLNDITRLHTTRTTVNNDKAFKSKTFKGQRIVNFYGPPLGDQTAKIAIYSGSFDPPHKCHMERLQILYEAQSIYKIFVGIIDKNERKPDMNVIGIRYKMLLLSIRNLLIFNKDKNIESFDNNPKENSSKIQVDVTTQSAGDTIMSIQTKNPGIDVIFTYGSDYSIKEGAETPLDDFDPPSSWDESKGNFYQNITQLQFLRSEETCNMSSTEIRETVEKFLNENKNYGNDEELAKLADKLYLDIEVLKLYISYLNKRIKPAHVDSVQSSNTNKVSSGNEKRGGNIKCLMPICNTYKIKRRKKSKSKTKKRRNSRKSKK